ncbi:hypothetical protein [Pseudoduganella lutea]|uniref:DUF2185 domain-containing protein n=1 Tax=Pseudoduganella lutea TaxID=321985 RepID=A0A4P6KTM8_9BURK|nr:hypothetical protein [Pseudoduganella lutea]QBE61762.1 hypothetical protein EWM63_01075 [Pseudoduganella lutea]
MKILSLLINGWAFTAAGIFRGERPSLLVVREDEDWQFLCGNVDNDDSLKPYHVSLGVLLVADLTLNEIADLLPGWEAERFEIGADWLKTHGQQ